jgi:hypothetical protein
MPEQHMLTFAHGPVSGKDFTKVQMEVWFTTTCSPKTKGNRIKCALDGQSHETKTIARHILGDQLQGYVVIVRLANHVAKTLGQKVSPQDGKFFVIEMTKARVAKSALA